MQQQHLISSILSSKIYTNASYLTIKFDTVPIPRRAKSRVAKAVGPYADILMGLANPQDDKPGYNANPIRP
eukprot:1686287-Ditylum_brightwellii.AAC.1